MKPLIILLALLVVLPAACGDDDGVTSQTGATIAEMTIVRPGVTDSAAIGVGDRLMVILESNPSTGFGWNLESDPACLELLGEPEWVSRTGLAGSTGDLLFTFEAVNPGSDELTFAYRRPWETTPALSIETLDVLVD